jgi:tetratricopeptide (TPR) repeat protein
MTLPEEVLEEIVSGHQDLAKATADYKKGFEANNQFQDLEEKLFSAVQQKKWDDAQATLNEIFVLIPRTTNRFSFTTTRLQILLGQKKYGEAYALADDTGKAHAADDYRQKELAWTIAMSDSPDEQCLSLANTMAERAVQLTKATNSTSLDTLARVQFMLGKKPEAIATEKKAANLALDKREKSALEKKLASYRQGKLPDAEE